MLFRRKSAAEAGAPAGVTALAFIEAELFPDMSGWWVYALCDIGDGHVFYAGQSDHFLSRIRDHSYQFKGQFDPARVWVRKVEDQAEADLYELLLIRRYDPERNTVGRRGELEGRLRAENRPFKKGHKHSPKPGYLDSRQETV